MGELAPANWLYIDRTCGLTIEGIGVLLDVGTSLQFQEGNLSSFRLTGQANKRGSKCLSVIQYELHGHSQRILGKSMTSIPYAGKKVHIVTSRTHEKGLDSGGNTAVRDVN